MSANDYTPGIATPSVRAARRVAHALARADGSMARGDGSARHYGSGHGAKLRVAMVAPPWISVPPPGYGGIESVIALLCTALAERGHAVTLFAAPGSQCAGAVQAPLQRAHPEAIGASMYEADFVASVFAAAERPLAGGRGTRFDLIHDHSGYTAVAMADRVRVPVVHTIHGPLNGDAGRFYRRHGHKVVPVAISRAQLRLAEVRLQAATVVHNPIDVRAWPFVERKQRYVLWAGRMDPIKGAHRAVAAARLAGWPLVVAGPVQPGQHEYFRARIEPYVDGRCVKYVGEVGGERKRRLFAQAAALLMPIRWDEPFGMVMVEALACGTPVIAFPEGAASELVAHGETGFLVGDEREMAAALARLPTLEPVRCRESVARRFSPAAIARGYEQVYRRALARARELRPQPAAVAHGPAAGRGAGAPWRAPERAFAGRRVERDGAAGP